MPKSWLLAALALAGAAPEQIPAGAPMSVDIGGRVVTDPDGARRFGWPGVYFQGVFKGTAVTVGAEARDEQLALLIDGTQRMVLTKASPTYVTIDRLAPGDHIVRLEKLTESQAGSARFLGFWAGEGGVALSPWRPTRQIEFIGDSHSVGYGNTSATRDCTRQQVHDTTNTQLAFGPLFAKLRYLGYRVIAYSGYGIVRNYDGGVPGDSLPKRYLRAIPGEEAVADDSGWQPDQVVIDLGSNDFSTPLHAGEAWADPAALHADYRATYVAFVRMLLARYPKARFLLMRYDLFDADVLAVVEALKDSRVTSAKFGPFELTGCDWHPSVKDHRAIADRLEALIPAATILDERPRAVRPATR